MAKAKAVHKCTQADSLEYVVSTSLKFFESIGSPIALKCYMLLKYKEYDQLIRCEVNPSDYLNSDTFFSDYQATSFLKKYPFDTATDKKAVALEKFLAAERQCKLTNLSFDEKVRPFSNLLHEMKKEVSRVLGELPEISSLPFRFGPGATGAVSGDAVTIPDKLKQGKIQCSRSAIPFALSFIKSLPHYYEAKTGLCVNHRTFVCATQWRTVTQRITPVDMPTPTFDLMNHNSLTFVPKNGKTDRCICIEPDFMVPMQLAYGNYIKKRLKSSAGIDLSIQQEINGEFARRGSLHGDYATIDLSAASDSISIALVAEVLPPDWFDALSCLRSAYTNIGTHETPNLIENEKFSSMGNGFTFELETLLFLAAAKAVKRVLGAEGRVMAYGDDLIVPTNCASMLIDFLGSIGFSTNEEKTFTEGPFRESCGKDFFQGRYVRPQFLTKEIKYENEKFKVPNRIRQFAMDFYNYHRNCSDRFRACWEYSISKINRGYHFFGPLEFGDDVIFSPYAERGLPPEVCGITKINVVVFRPKRKALSGFARAVQTAAALYGASNQVPIRGRGLFVTSRRNTVVWCREIGSWAEA